MQSCFLLQEDDFSLEFRVTSALSTACDNLPRPDALDGDAYVLQERIIVPPSLARKASGFSLENVDPSRCNDPLILLGHPDLAVQHSAIIARPEEGKATIRKHSGAIKMTAPEMNLLFSAPICRTAGNTKDSYLSAFDRITEILTDNDMPGSSIARVWLFTKDILKDYDILNEAREQFFRKQEPALNRFFPASTATHGRIKDDEDLSAEFCAFSGERLSVVSQSSPLQNEAVLYGKLFTRAAVVRLPRNRLIFISGTASIDRNGASRHAGDFQGQLAFTLEVISKILHELSADFSNIVQAAIYIKRNSDMNSCVRILDEADFPSSRGLFLPDVDLCRHDLLCEIEATAVVPA